MVTFRIDPASGLSAYGQIAHQVRQALRLGTLREGDRLPTVREVVAQVAVNPNTVLKAYRELEHEGLVEGRQGVGTFVTSSAAVEALRAQARLRPELVRWLGRARRSGLSQEDVTALFDFELRQSYRGAA